MTQQRLMMRYVVTAVAMVCVGACSGADSTSPGATTILTTATVDADVAATVADVVLSDLDNMAINESLTAAGYDVTLPTTSGAPGLRATVLTQTPTVAGYGNCTFSDGGKAYSCQVGEGEGSYSSSRTNTYFDTAGVLMDAFQRGVTQRVVSIMTIDGNIARDSGVTNVTHRRDSLSITGFATGNTRIYDGVGNGSDTSMFTRDSVHRSYAGSYSDTTKALTWFENRAQNPYPQSGSTVHVIDLTASSRRGDNPPETKQVDAVVTITYSGSTTPTAAMTIVTSAGTRTCTLHLDTHKIDGCH